jgi:enterochelin esterase-like enzyme
MPDPAAAHEAYATWLTEVVIPRARKEAPVIPDPAHTTLDGCSMGGPIGLEVFLRRPDHFAAWGSVQSAFGVQRAKGFAERLAAASAKMARVAGKGPMPAFHLEISEGDMFRESNLLLSGELTARGVPHDLLDLPGPHDQPWLREAGTLAMLLWHDRRPR